MEFNLTSTLIYQVLKWEQNPFFKLRKPLKRLFFWFSFLFFGLAGLSVFTSEISAALGEKFIGGGILSICSWILFLVLTIFFEDKSQSIQSSHNLAEFLAHPDTFNLANFLDFESAKICEKSFRTASQKISSEFPNQHILLYFLLDHRIKEIQFVFSRMNIPLEPIRLLLKPKTYPHSSVDEEKTKKLMLEAGKIAFKREKKKIGVGDILLSFMSNDSFCQKLLIKFDFFEKDVRNLVDWFERVSNNAKKAKRFWDYQNLIRRGTLAKDWAAGYTIHLDRFSLDLRESIQKFGFKKFYGHDKEIQEVERILEKKTVNNVLLVGESGSGRRSIVEAVAQKAFLNQSLLSLNSKRFLEFDLGALSAQIESPEETEATIDICFQEAIGAGNIVLVIHHLQDFLEKVSPLGSVNISGILGRYLPLSSFQIIGIVDYEGLHKILEMNPGILNLFDKVEVSEVGKRETLEMLEEKVPFYELTYKKFIVFKTLREIIKLSDRYLPNISFPEKALEILEEVMVYVSRRPGKLVTAKEVAVIITQKAKVPIGEIETQERKKLLNLEKLIHQMIIDQNDAVREISTALRRSRSGVQLRKGTIGNFLFLGPTGVGKTETAKALSKIYFGSEDKMIRLNMSEFQSIDDIPRLIGSEKEEGLLTTPVRENPFSLILLDELEKAHPNILNLFLQVLDEGYLTDGVGRKVFFKNNIIIATSNAGAEVIREDIEKNQKLDMVKKDLLDYLLRKRIFRPEFINRFDAVVVFKPLTKESLLGIAGLLLGKLRKNILEKGIDLIITEELKQKIVELGYSPSFGARAMKRVLQNTVENALAKSILDGKLKRGNQVKVDPESFRLIIKEE